MVDMSEPLDKELKRIMQRFVDAKEQYLLKVFGSYEVAQAVADQYVFEESDFDFTLDGDTYKVGYNFRVRPKTKEEFDADRARRQSQPTEARDVLDIHEWVWMEFSYAGWLECAGCGYKPISQEDMDEHIPPVARAFD